MLTLFWEQWQSYVKWKIKDKMGFSPDYSPLVLLLFEMWIRKQEKHLFKLQKWNKYRCILDYKKRVSALSHHYIQSNLHKRPPLYMHVPNCQNDLMKTTSFLQWLMKTSRMDTNWNVYDQSQQSLCPPLAYSQKHRHLNKVFHSFIHSCFDFASFIRCSKQKLSTILIVNVANLIYTLQ